MSNEPINEILTEGILNLGNGIEMPCYVLKNGIRILSGRGMQNAILNSDPDKKAEEKAGNKLANLLSSKWFKELIVSQYGLEHFSPIICYKGGQKINGYEATTLADLCNIILEGRAAGYVKTPQQERIAIQCEILIRSFAKVGIIALVDEATGYQYDREKIELQSILQTFISDEILKWQETFQLSFYKEIFRLWGVPFTAQNIKRKPMFIGKLTNELVYKNMPKGYFVLDTLKQKTPKTEAGNFRYRLHQSLTPDVGREALKKVIYSVETLASIADNKAKFLKLMRDKYHPQKELPFPELDNLAKSENKKEPITRNLHSLQLKGLLNTPPKKAKS